MDHTDLVYEADGTCCELTENSAETRGSVDSPEFRTNASTQEEALTDGMSVVWERLRNEGVPSEIFHVIKQSWRDSTKMQYSTYLKRWHVFSSKRNIDIFRPSVNDVLAFLLHLYSSGLSYSAINTARSALSCTICDGNDTIGKHPLVTSFLKGIFKLKPTRSRYKCIWDVNIVFDYIRQLPDNESLSLKILSFKIVTLIALVSAQRVQSLFNLCLSGMKEESDRFILYLGKIKQSRPKFSSMYITIHKFDSDQNLCIYCAFVEYLKRTSGLSEVSCDKIFVSFYQPHKAVLKSTLARWIKSMLAMSGVNINMFSAHSTRVAVASAANKCDIPVGDILNLAGWSSETTFARHYCEPVLKNNDVNIMCCVKDN